MYVRSARKLQDSGPQRYLTPVSHGGQWEVSSVTAGCELQHATWHSWPPLEQGLHSPKCNRVVVDCALLCADGHIFWN